MSLQVAKAVCFNVSSVLAIEQEMQIRWKSLTRGFWSCCYQNKSDIIDYMLKNPTPLCCPGTDIKPEVRYLSRQSPQVVFTYRFKNIFLARSQIRFCLKCPAVPWLSWTVRYICTGSCFPLMANVTLTFLCGDFHNPKQDSHTHTPHPCFIQDILFLHDSWHNPIKNSTFCSLLFSHTHKRSNAICRIINKESIKADIHKEKDRSEGQRVRDCVQTYPHTYKSFAPYLKSKQFWKRAEVC